MFFSYSGGIYKCIFFTVISYYLVNTILKKEQVERENLKKLSNHKGKIATVKKDIGKTLSIDGIGLIDYEQILYKAKSIDDKEIKAGSKVEIVSRENDIFNVKAVK